MPSSTPPPPSGRTTRSWNLYLNIYELPFSKFLDCIVDDNLSALIKEGYPPEIELLTTWQSISEQYANACGNSEYSLYFNLFKRIGIITQDLADIHNFIELLSIIYYEPIARELNSLLKTNFRFDPSNQIEYQATLKRCYNRSRGLKIELDLKKLQYEEMEKKLSKNEKPTREYYYKILITLSDHAGYDLRPDMITVFEYCERLQRLKKHFESAKPKHGR